MTKYIIGFIGGLIFSAVIISITVPRALADKFDEGKHRGRLETTAELFERIKTVFGPLTNELEFKVDDILFSYKINDVVITQEKGIKTVRVR